MSATIIMVVKSKKNRALAHLLISVTDCANALFLPGRQRIWPFTAFR